MTSAVSKWMLEHYPVFFIFLAILVGCIVATVYIIKYVNRFKKVETTCDKIPVMEKEIKAGVQLSEVINHKIDTNTQAYGELTNKIGNLNSSVSALIAFLTTKHDDLQGGFFKSFSPIQLTEIGLDLLTKCGGKTYIDTHIGNLMSSMEMQEFKSGLDVQNHATTIIVSFFNSDDFVDIRNYIYKNPMYRTGQGKEIPVSASSIYQVMGIYLRDKYFEKHPALKDID